MSFSTISEVFMPFAVEFSAWWSSRVSASRSKKSGIDTLCYHLWVSQVMIFGLSHGSLRGSLQLLCAAAGYLGAFVAFMRSDTDSNAAWHAGLMSSYTQIIYDNILHCIYIYNPHIPSWCPDDPLGATKTTFMFQFIESGFCKSTGKRCTITPWFSSSPTLPYLGSWCFSTVMPLYCGSAEEHPSYMSSTFCLVLAGLGDQGRVLTHLLQDMPFGIAFGILSSQLPPPV